MLVKTFLDHSGRFFPPPRLDVAKHEVTFATRRGFNPPTSRGYATGDDCNITVTRGSFIILFGKLYYVQRLQNIACRYRLKILI